MQSRHFRARTAPSNFRHMKHLAADIGNITLALGVLALLAAFCDR
jgi:hypothetical protein